MSGEGGGWAKLPGDGEPQSYGPLTSDMVPPRGVLLSDMPGPRPSHPRPHIKGVPGASPAAGSDDDHAPGRGTWTPVT
jgi:hypothetical protein